MGWRKCRRIEAVCVSVALTIGIGFIPTVSSQAQTTGQTSSERVQPGGVSDGASQNNLPDPKLKLSPVEELRKFEPPADEEYTLGAGDEISVEYPGRPELSSKAVIGPDGRITLSLAGPIVIAGLTREAAEQKIVEALSKYYSDITATVEVVKYGSNHVTLLGDVKNPGLIDFDQTPTLLEVLSKGGVETQSDGEVPEQCVIYRGEQVVWVELQELLMTGSPVANLRLRRNDIIFVPSAAARTVSVMGQVEHPGEVILKHNSTLTSVLGEAGGINDAAGSNPEIQIVHRFKGGTSQEVRFKDLLRTASAAEITLYPGDVVFVPKSGMSKMGFVMQQLAPFLSMGSFAALAVH